MTGLELLLSVLSPTEVPVLVHSPSPFLSLTSTGLTAKKYPGALGVYSISETTRIFHQLVGYSLLPHQTDSTEQEEEEKYYIFKDYSQQSTEFVSKVPFSLDGKGRWKM